MVRWSNCNIERRYHASHLYTNLESFFIISSIMAAAIQHPITAGHVGQPDIAHRPDLDKYPPGGKKTSD
jgi:hypothetical protein